MSIAIDLCRYRKYIIFYPLILSQIVKPRSLVCEDAILAAIINLSHQQEHCLDSAQVSRPKVTLSSERWPVLPVLSSPHIILKYVHRTLNTRCSRIMCDADAPLSGPEITLCFCEHLGHAVQP